MQINTLTELMRVFFKLGCTSFGGPVAHIALMQEEVVVKRNWMSRQHFLDLVGATNLIPGPNSTEMALHCGYLRGKLPGMIVAGLSFILPAVIITGILAFMYTRYGALPAVAPVMYGIKPAVIIIILHAVYTLGQKAIKGWKFLLIAIGVAAINFAGVNEIFSILLGSFFGMIFILSTNRKKTLNSFIPFPLIAFFALLHQVTSVDKESVSLTKLFLICLKIGAVLFGGGYILAAYINGEFVQGLHWLSKQQLLDAIAVGQFTPGPILSSATFIGYQIAGIPGAVLATVGIFLPSFVFVLISNPIIPRLRNSRTMSVFLDAVNVSAIALMIVVVYRLGFEVLIDWKSWLIAIVSITLFVTVKKIKPIYIIIGGAVMGYALYFIG